MGYRIVKINNRCKLETKLNYLVCVTDHETRILLDEIAILILESQQICITNALLTELVKHKIKVILCDEQHNPLSELTPYYATFDSTAKIKQQIAWKRDIKELVWTRIVKQKINNQARVLLDDGFIDSYNLLKQYISTLTLGDSTNREGLAAKQYFSTLFGSSFDRRDRHNKINVFLNYGYSLLLSSFNKEIASFGYLTQLGIHHIGETNPFNLSCDLMEPFRPFIDKFVLSTELDDDNFKTQLMNAMTLEINYSNKNMILENAIKQYVLSVFSALNSNDITEIDEPTFKDEQL